jgi:hypothetical protein
VKEKKFIQAIFGKKLFLVSVFLAVVTAIYFSGCALTPFISNGNPGWDLTESSGDSPLYLMKIKPKEGYCYHGVFVGTTDYNNDYFGLSTLMPPFTADANKGVRILQQFISWAYSSVTFLTLQQDCNEILDYGAYPMITWEPDCKNADIAAGLRDSYIESWAASIKNWKKPLFIRLMHEMNASWYVWGLGNSGNTAESYIAAWRYVVDKFNSIGTSNVTWVWCPNVDPLDKIGVCYPGDDYVDWMGIDVYNWGSSYPWGRNLPFIQILAAPYQVLTSLSSKPIMMAEYSSVDTVFGVDKAEWTSNALIKIKSDFPAVKAALWYSEIKVQDGITFDWRIESSTSARDAYRNGIADSYYLGNETLPTVGAAYVSLAGSHTYPYDTWAKAATNIQPAAEVVVDGGTVWVTNGVYSNSEVFYNGLTNRLAVKKPIIVRSVNGPALTIIEGKHGTTTTGPFQEDAVRCVYLSQGASLIGFTLQNGGTAQYVTGMNRIGGGAVYSENSNCFVSNCVCSNNNAFDGGAVHGGTFYNCVLISNTGYNGGAVSGSTLYSCVIKNNQGYAGGGAVQSTLYNCQLLNNSAYSGGGAYLSSLSNCSLLSNSACYGGGFNSGGGLSDSTSLYNCSIIGNSAQGGGGGGAGGNYYNCLILNNIASNRMGGTSGGGGVEFGKFYNCTIVGNRSEGNGGGIVGGTVYNSIIISNTAAGGLNWANSPNINYSCTTPLASGNGNIDADPKFVDFASGDFRLLPTSPCINSGIYPTEEMKNIGLIDLDGNDRIVGRSIDMGVYEYQTIVSPPVSASTTYVSLQGLHVAPYDTWEKAATNIQSAIDAVEIGGTVIVSNGLYDTGGTVIPGSGSLSNRVVMTNGIIMRSLNGPASTIISGQLDPNRRNALGFLDGLGDGAVRGVYMGKDSALIGFTIQGGHTRGYEGTMDSEQSGGGVYCEDFSAVVSNCRLIQNHSLLQGGGICRGTVYDSQLSNNISAGSGGGASMSKLYRCQLIWNCGHSAGGGASFSFLYYCTLSFNDSTDYGSGGGAIESYLYHCIVTNNEAFYGGGVVGGNSYNSLIKGNHATAYGGGAHGGSLYNCTIVDNSASGYGSPEGSRGGGVYLSAVYNSIVCFNNAPTYPNFYQGALSYSCSFPLAAGEGNITNDPQFVSFAGGDYHLNCISPCIDKGKNESWMNNYKDFDGNPRIMGNRVDMGIYEFDIGKMFGIYSESYPTTMQFSPPGNNGLFEGWNSGSQNPSIFEINNSGSGDGSKSMQVFYSQNIYGSGLHYRALPVVPGKDMRVFTNGYLVLSINVPMGYPDIKIEIERNVYEAGNSHHRSTVTIGNGAYGFLKDGNWHQVIVPFSDFFSYSPLPWEHPAFAASDMEFVTTLFGIVFGDNLSGSIQYDHVYWVRP